MLAQTDEVVTLRLDMCQHRLAYARSAATCWKRHADIGRAISPEEQGRLLDVAAGLRSPVVRTAIPLLMLTGLRSGEALGLRWQRVDLFSHTITVGRAKTSSGIGRVTPINDELLGILGGHRAWFADI